MKASTYFALDLGAGSGRAILGSIDNKIKLEEVHRFRNLQIYMLGHYHWDILNLFEQFKIGLGRAAARGFKELNGIGVDTWGVDFGLVGRNNTLLGNPVTYRDGRTNGMMEEAYKLLDREKIYEYTGIQFMQFNSIFQLLSMVKSDSPLLDSAEKLLFTPDLLNFFATGIQCSEYSIASTSQLLNASKKQWEPVLFEKLNIPLNIMAPLVTPGTIVGPLLKDILSDTGVAPVDVIAPGCHDTASAVAAVPAQSDDWAYLSSGTWSLLGIEVDEPIINADSQRNNFTNEGGVDHKIRFLRNVMGMWLLEECKKQWERQGDSLSYEELLQLASSAKAFKCIVDPDNDLFLNPVDMPAAITEFCQNTNQSVPESKGEFVRCILESLALKYRFVLDNINHMRGKPITKLHVVGGGSKNQMLNQFTANATGIEVVAGPVEATAIGNILIQALAKKELGSLQEGRDLVTRSFKLKEFTPEDQEAWGHVYYAAKEIFKS